MATQQLKTKLTNIALALSMIGLAGSAFATAQVVQHQTLKSGLIDSYVFQAGEAKAFVSRYSSLGFTTDENPHLCVQNIGGVTADATGTAGIVGFHTTTEAFGSNFNMLYRDLPVRKYGELEYPINANSIVYHRNHKGDWHMGVSRPFHYNLSGTAQNLHDIEYSPITDALTKTVLNSASNIYAGRFVLTNTGTLYKINFTATCSSNKFSSISASKVMDGVTKVEVAGSNGLLITTSALDLVLLTSPTNSIALGKIDAALNSIESKVAVLGNGEVFFRKSDGSYVDKSNSSITPYFYGKGSAANRYLPEVYGVNHPNGISIPANAQEVRVGYWNGYRGSARVAAYGIKDDAGNITYEVSLAGLPGIGTIRAASPLKFTINQAQSAALGKLVGSRLQVINTPGSLIIDGYHASQHISFNSYSMVIANLPIFVFENGWVNLVSASSAMTSDGNSSLTLTPSDKLIIGYSNNIPAGSNINLELGTITNGSDICDFSLTGTNVNIAGTLTSNYPATASIGVTATGCRPNQSATDSAFQLYNPDTYQTNVLSKTGSFMLTNVRDVAEPGHPLSTATVSINSTNEAMVDPYVVMGMDASGNLYSKGVFNTANRALADSSGSRRYFATSKQIQHPIGEVEVLTTPAASRGKFNNKIETSWIGSGTQYKVNRQNCTNGSCTTDVNGVTVNEPKFVDTSPNTNARASTTFRNAYVVQPFLDLNIYPTITATTTHTVAGNSKISNLGYLSSPPSATSATLTIASNTTTPTDLQISVTDGDEENEFTYEILTQPQHGSVIIGADGKLKYSVGNNYYGNDSFTYRVHDANGGHADGTASVVVNCPPPELLSFGAPTSVKALQDNVFTYQYKANLCNGPQLDAKFTAGSGSTLEIPRYTKISNVTSSTATVQGMVSFADPDPAIYSATLEIASKTIPANKATRTLQATVTGLSNRTYSLTPLIPTEDDLVTGEIAFEGKDCKFHKTQSDAKAFRECFVEWVSPLVDQEITVTPDKVTIKGYGELGGPHEVLARIFKADSAQNMRLVDTLAKTVYVTPGTPVTFNLPSFTTPQRQFLDWIDFSLTQKTGQTCVMTTSSTRALTEAKAGNKVCLIEFVSLPAGLRAATDGSVRVTGRLESATAAVVRFRASKFFANKAPVVIAETDITIPVEASVMAGNLTFDRPEYAKGLQVATATASITGNPTCTITNSPIEAKTSHGKAGALTCYGEWNNLPSWMTMRPGNRLIAAGTVPATAGDYPLSYSLFMIDAADKRTLIGTYSGNVKVVDLPVITMAITPANIGMEGSDGGAVFAVDSQGLIGSITLGGASFATIRATATMGTAIPMISTGIKQGESRELRIQVSNNPAWQTSDLAVRMEYEGVADQSNTRTQTIKVAQLPPKTMSAAIETTGQLVNSLPFSLRGRIGTPSGSATNLAYSKLAQGSWTAYVGALEAGAVVPLTTSQVVGDTGFVTFDGLTYQDVAGRDIVIVAEPVVPEGLVLQTPMQVISPVAKLSFVSGAPIFGNVIVDKVKGEVPHNVRLDLQVTQADSGNLGTVNWEVSTDSGATWSELEGAFGKSTSYRFMQGGSYWVRAKVFNKHSGAVTQSNAVAVDVKQSLRIVLEGVEQQLPGRDVPLTLSVTDTTGGAVQYDTIWNIQASDGSRETHENIETLTLSTDKLAVYEVTVRAKPKKMDGGLPEAWSTLTKTVRFMWPDRVRVSLGGSKRAETGPYPVELTAKVVSSALNASNAGSIVSKGQWELPAGVTTEDPLDSPAINVVFDPETYGNGDTVAIVYRAWIDGAKERTEATATHNVQLSQYEFAQFVLSKKSETAVAPAYLRLQVEPANTNERKKIGSQKLIYTWSIPESDAVTAKVAGSGLTLTADMPGNYPIAVSVEDERGNKQEMSYVLNVTEPGNYALSMALKEGLKFNRAPMTFAMRPTLGGGHPKDKVTKYELFVNGASVSETSGNRPPRAVVIPDAGEHTIKLVASTLMEKSATAEETVTVNPNQPPVCEDLRVVWDRRGTSASITSSCKDVDGRLKGYKWFVNDSLLEKRQGNRVSLSPDQIGSSAEVKLQVFDDSAAVTEQTVTLTPPGAASR